MLSIRKWLRKCAFKKILNFVKLTVRYTNGKAKYFA